MDSHNPLNINYHVKILQNFLFIMKFVSIRDKFIRLSLSVLKSLRASNNIDYKIKDHYLCNPKGLFVFTHKPRIRHIIDVKARC